MPNCPKVFSSHWNFYIHGTFYSCTISPSMTKTANAANSFYNIYHLGIFLFFHQLFQSSMNETYRRDCFNNSFIFNYQIKMYWFRQYRMLWSERNNSSFTHNNPVSYTHLTLPTKR